MSEELTNKIIKVSRITIPLICLIGAGFSAASLYNHTALMYGLNVGPSFCNISDRINCDAVSASKFSILFGVPLEVYGLSFYLSLFVLALISLRNRLIPQRVFYNVLLVLSVLASLASIVLFAISQFVIGAMCILCIGVYVTNLSLLVVSLGVGEKESFAARCSHGASKLLFLPLSIFTAPRSVRLKVWGLTLGLCILISTLYSAPWLLATFIASRSPVRMQMEEVAKLAFDDWAKQSPVDITANESGVLKDYARGPAFAPLQLVEFSDFECPACRNFYGVLEDLLKEYGDKVHFVFRNYPLDRACNQQLDFDMHKNACAAAVYARCAGEQGKFWESVHYLFELPEMDEGKSKKEVDAAIMRASEVLNLDGHAIQECIQSGRQLERIQQDIAEGEKLGLTGTPSLWLNGRKVKVANGIILKHIFDKILAAAP